MTKPYGGKIYNWRKIDVSSHIDAMTTSYGPNLGYMISGRIDKDHVPGRGFDNGPIRTSLVVKHEGDKIETLNTRYDLGEQATERD